MYSDREPYLVGRGVLTAPQAGGLRTARRTSQFIECLLTFLRLHWDHELMEIPLARPSDTLSPSGGEGRGEGVRWLMEREHLQNFDVS